MEAFLHPLQGLAEFEEIKKRCGANCGILNVSRLYGIPEGTSDVWTFRAISPMRPIAG